MVSNFNYCLRVIALDDLVNSALNFASEMKMRSFSRGSTHIAQSSLTSSSVVNNPLSLEDRISYSNEEVTSNFRQQRFQNPVFRYNYKIGHYFTKSDLFLHSTLFTTQSELTGGIRKSAWFLSPMFSELFTENVQMYLTFISKPVREEAFADAMYTPSRVRPTDGFYNFFLLLSESNDLINCR